MLRIVEAKRWIERIVLATEGHHSALRARAMARAAFVTTWSDPTLTERLAREALTIARELGDPTIEALALNALGQWALHRGDPRAALGFQSEALALAERLGNQVRIAHAVGELGRVASLELRFDEAIALWQRALAIRQSLGDEFGATMAVYQIARIQHNAGAGDRARPLLRQALARARAIRLPFCINYCLANLGDRLRMDGDVDEARSLLEEAVDATTRGGDLHLASQVLGYLAQIERDAGNLARARQHLRGALAYVRAEHPSDHLIRMLEWVASVDGLDGAPGRGARLLGAADRMRTRQGVPRTAVEQSEFDRCRRRIVDALGMPAFEALAAEGAEMPVAEIVAYVRAEPATIS
jgi:tetratricopeptide (TPR) repeat protein